jgi:hypothetical protein
MRKRTRKQDPRKTGRGLFGGEMNEEVLARFKRKKEDIRRRELYKTHDF